MCTCSWVNGNTYVCGYLYGGQGIVLSIISQASAIFCLKRVPLLGVAAYTSNLGTWESEAGESM